MKTSFREVGDNAVNVNTPVGNLECNWMLRWGSGTASFFWNDICDFIAVMSIMTFIYFGAIFLGGSLNLKYKYININQCNIHYQFNQLNSNLNIPTFKHIRKESFSALNPELRRRSISIRFFRETKKKRKKRKKKKAMAWHDVALTFLIVKVLDFFLFIFFKLWYKPLDRVSFWIKILSRKMLQVCTCFKPTHPYEWKGLH